METSEPVNPYEVTALVDDRPLPDPAHHPVPSDGAVERKTSLTQTAVRWFLICGISAIPSFVLAIHHATDRPIAMLTGILLFAIGYTALDYSTALTAFRRNANVSLTLRITYGIRIAMTIGFPAALYCDLLCGFVSVPLAELLLGGQQNAMHTFPGVVFTTIVHGLTMNVLLAGIGLLVFVVQWGSRKVWDSIPTG